jgi:hypothetical protein
MMKVELRALWVFRRLNLFPKVLDVVMDRRTADSFRPLYIT